LRKYREPKPDYRILQRKIFARIALLIVIALAVVVLLYLIASNNSIGDYIVYFLQYNFRMPYEQAHQMYWMTRSSLPFIMIAAVALIFIILSRLLYTQFAKYFNEISGGLDVLVGDRDGEIQLSNEMAPMERKLKTIKRELEDRERESKLAEQRKNEMVMYLAHDIKTPLTSVLGYLSLLDEAPDMPPEQKAKYVNITLEKAQRLEKLVDEFFEITRFNFQTDTLSKDSFDLSYMLTQIIDEFFPLLSETGKQAILNAPESLMVFGDPEKLARVFNNVLKNAIAYSQDNSVISIYVWITNAGISGAGAAGGTVSIAFKNPGSIPADKLAAIFEKFYRLDSSRSTDSGGAGLGLAIAKEIVSAHGGHIFAESDDEYTTFTVELPY